VSESARPAWVVAAVFGLTVMVSWTLVVKYLAPLLWGVAEARAGRPGELPVMWDLWPLTHVALAVWLWRGARGAREAALALALAECAVVSIKFALFARAPEWTFWKLLWLTNKVYVLLFFGALAAVVVARGRRDFDGERKGRWATIS
jgi:hypothetical protein